MVWGKAVEIELTQAERQELETRSRRRKIGRADANRAAIVLSAAEGLSNVAIAERVGVTGLTVALWRRRFAEARLARHAWKVCPTSRARGRRAGLTTTGSRKVVTSTLESLPQDATHWSTRSMARASAVSAAAVHRIWRAFCLQPHRTETFKLSTDPLFVEKVRDIVGL